MFEASGGGSAFLEQNNPAATPVPVVPSMAPPIPAQAAPGFQFQQQPQAADPFSGFSQFTGGLEQITARAAEGFAKDPATRQMYGERRERKETQDIQVKMQRRKELLDQSNMLTELIAKNPQAMQSKVLQQQMQQIRSELGGIDSGLGDSVAAQWEVAASMPSEAEKPTVLAPGAILTGKGQSGQYETLASNPRAEGGMQSPPGKVVADWRVLVEAYGPDSEEVKRFDDANKNEVGMKPSDISAMRAQFIQGSKTFVDVRDALKRVDASISAPSAASDITLIFAYMRMLDPASTVRENEFATAQNATGVPGAVRNFFNKLRTGERLNPEQRADFYRQAKSLFQGAVESHLQLESEFSNLAGRSRVDPRDIVIDYLGALRGQKAKGGGADDTNQPGPPGGNKFDTMSVDQLLNVDVNSLTSEQEAAYEAAMKKKGF